MKWRSDLIEPDPLPQDVFDALQEYISTYVAANFSVVIANPTTLRVPAGAGNDQVGIGIDGKWRYNAANADCAAPGTLSVGDNPLFVATAENAFGPNPAPPPSELDSTDYSFRLLVLPPGGTPSGTGSQAHWRQIGVATWDGSQFTAVKLTVATSSASDLSNGTTGSGAIVLAVSPAMTGTPTVPTAPLDTSTIQVASTAFVLGQAAASVPLPDGVSAVGTSTRYARADHVHPGSSYNVKTYGAIGDGVVDDTVAILAAIAAATLAGSGLVYFPPGTYKISSTLLFNRTAVSFAGAGSGSRESSNPGAVTTIVWAGATNTPIVQCGDGGTTTVFGFKIHDIAINGSGIAGVTGVLLDQRVSNCRFGDVLVYGCDVGWDLLNFCFANRWTNCTVYGFTSRGWKLRNGNHNSVFVGCKGWGNFGLTMVAASPYTVEIGAEGFCTSVAFYSCDFEAWQVAAQIKVQQANGFSWFGGYMESKDSVAVAMIDFGGVGACNWAEVAGGDFTGNSNPNAVFKFTNLQGGRITAEGGGGSLTNIVNNVSCANVRLGGKWSTSVPLSNSYVGITTDAMAAGTDYETLVDLATVTPSGYHNGGTLSSVSQTTTIASPGAAADEHTYTFRIKSASVQTLVWNAIFRGSLTYTLPVTTTGGSKWDYIQFRYNQSAAAWDLVGLVQGC